MLDIIGKTQNGTPIYNHPECHPHRLDEEAEVELAELGEPITEDDTDGCRWFSDGNLFSDYDDEQDDHRKERYENYGPVEKDELPF